MNFSVILTLALPQNLKIAKTIFSGVLKTFLTVIKVFFDRTGLSVLGGTVKMFLNPCAKRP